MPGLGGETLQLVHIPGPDQVRGQPLEELDVWVEPDRGVFLAKVREEGRVERFEARHRRADGRVFDALLWSETLELDGRDCVVSVVDDISERRQLEQELRRRAFHDSLTGLANRDLLRDRLEHAFEISLRHDRRMALLFLDLDGFKAVNDEHGHVVGDALLRETARRLENSVRGHDTVARWGGDEFMVLLEEVGGRDDVAEAVRRLVEAVESPVAVDDLRLDVGISVGVAMGPDQDDSPEGMTLRADAAMYEAKRLGRNRVVLFDDTYARYYEPLVRAYEGAGMRVAMGMMRDEDAAHDALQEPAGRGLVMGMDGDRLGSWVAAQAVGDRHLDGDQLPVGAVAPQALVPGERGHCASLGRCIPAVPCPDVRRRAPPPLHPTSPVLHPAPGRPVRGGARRRAAGPSAARISPPSVPHETMDVQLTGEVVEILEEKSGESANGPWRKQDFILETNGQYPSKICITQWGDRIEEFDVSEGETLTVHVDIESREYKGRWYTDVKAWKVERDAAAREEDDLGDPPPFEGPPPGDEDDLPF